MPAKRTAPPEDLAARSFQQGCAIIRGHPMFTPLYYHADLIRRDGNRCPPDGWAMVTDRGAIHVHPKRRGKPEEWAYVLAHCLLHLGFGHFQARAHPRAWNAACDCFVFRFLADLKLGRAPLELRSAGQFGAQTEERLYDQFCAQGIPPELDHLGTAGRHLGDLLTDPAREVWQPKRVVAHHHSIDWAAALSRGIVAAVTSAVNVAAGIEPRLGAWEGQVSRAELAKRWFMSAYPLLGALAASFKLVEDPAVCQRFGIEIAAVDAVTRELFVNPAAGLDEEECRFVVAHELLHVGLRHDARCHGRDPFLWNVACDYVVNGWLVEMKVGALPDLNLLYDPTLKDQSAEAIYDLMATDLRKYRKLATLRGVGLGDILGGSGDTAGTDLDAFYRRCLAQGLDYHQEKGRGFLPAGLVEEIYALSQPPIPWDVELAHWFDHYFPPLEKERTYARPSRRQASTPDIPRPRLAFPQDELPNRTFGVVLDTSGSMDRELLAKALGAIASYSMARDVPVARVIFCDAAAYDQGYLAPEAIADRVQIRGRGGTVLQPAIDLLEHATDFPPAGPILIITDGWTDRLYVQHEHAFLMPDGARLPFVPRGPIFRVA